jgi:TusA-related sulfurtransferase
MQELDARGKSCPLPIVLTAKAVKTLAIGELLAVKADDRAFVPDIEAWCKKTGNELVGIETKEGFFEAKLRRVQ